MTLHDALIGAYAWGVEHATVILLAAIVVPLLGALGAQLGKGGRTDADGRAIASVVIATGALLLVCELIAIHVAHAFHRGILDADVRLALAPIAFVICGVAAVHWVFPLDELAGARSVGYLLAAFAGAYLLLKFFSMFGGWHMVIWGSLVELVVVLALFVYGLYWLFRRALRGG